MKILVCLALCCTAVLAVPSGISLFEAGKVADQCTDDVCKVSDGCRCASKESPVSSGEETPQLISLTFNEAVTDDLFTNYWKPLLFDRVNPDQQPIGATFFVQHEYTDYERVNNLYNHGFEIGVHSITNNALQTYWRTATEELLEQEFGGQKQIISKFANIPEEDIVGARTPQLQLAGNYSIEAYQASGLIYDSSWPTLSSLPLYPYTLDYLSTQQCLLGGTCPNEAFKNFWILPINDLRGQDNNECDTVASCTVSGSSDDIADWLISQVDTVRNDARQPLTLIISSSWLEYSDDRLEGFTKFLDKLATYDDVFLVSQKQVVDWMKNPVPLSSFKTDYAEKDASCAALSCALKNLDDEERIMKSCVSCPDNYPWLNNPEGN